MHSVIVGNIDWSFNQNFIMKPIFKKFIIPVLFNGKSWKRFECEIRLAKTKLTRYYGNEELVKISKLKVIVHNQHIWKFEVGNQLLFFTRPNWPRGTFLEGMSLAAFFVCFLLNLPTISFVSEFLERLLIRKLLKWKSNRIFDALKWS